MKQIIEDRIAAITNYLPSCKTPKSRAWYRGQLYALGQLLQAQGGPEAPTEADDGIEPGQSIWKGRCPGCNGELEVMHGDDPGEIGVLFNANEVKNNITLVIPPAPDQTCRFRVEMKYAEGWAAVSDDVLEFANTGFKRNAFAQAKVAQGCMMQLAKCSPFANAMRVIRPEPGSRAVFALDAKTVGRLRSGQR